MDLPIRIIMVLFVAVIVGGLIVLFSRELLNDARTNLNELDRNELGEDHILDLERITDDQTLALANQCIREYTGTFDERICFAVFTNEAYDPVAIDAEPLLTGFTLTVDNPDAHAFKIIFAPTEAKIYMR